MEKQYLVSAVIKDECLSLGMYKEIQYGNFKNKDKAIKIAKIVLGLEYCNYSTNHLNKYEIIGTKVYDIFTTPKTVIWKMEKKDIIEEFNADFNKVVESRNSTLTGIEVYCKLHPDFLVKLQMDLKEIESYQYGRLSKGNVKLVNKYVNEIIMNDTKLSQLFQSFLDGILNHQNKLISINKELGRSVPHKYKIFFKERRELFYNRAGNIILKELKENLFKEKNYV